MNTHRYGNFSSSEIWKIANDGKKGELFLKSGLTYIQEKRYELNLGRSLNSETSSKPTSWGTFLESRVFDLLSMEYSLESTTRLAHPTIEHWTGAPDTLRENFVGDIKCPYTLKSFCESVEAITSGLSEFKRVRPEYYWQLISNGILADKTHAEIIFYVPYLSEIEAIRELANDYEGDQNKIAWINWAADADLPHILEGMKYENMYKFEFEIPKEDKEHLTKKVKEGIKLLKQ